MSFDPSFTSFCWQRFDVDISSDSALLGFYQRNFVDKKINILILLEQSINSVPAESWDRRQMMKLIKDIDDVDVETGPYEEWVAEKLKCLFYHAYACEQHKRSRFPSPTIRRCSIPCISAPILS